MTQNLSITKSTEQLNKQILDYYYNFGQNRDLEKYLRLNRKHNKSSSESSLGGLSCKYSSDICPANNLVKRQSKSLDYFEKSSPTKCDLENRKCDQEIIDHPQKSEYLFSQDNNKSIEIISDNLSGAQFTSDTCKEGMEELNQSYRSLLSNQGLSGLCESLMVESTETKDNLPLDDSGDLIEINTKFEVHLKDKGNEISDQKTAKILEWDSLGDVGYSRSALNPNLNRSMSTIERSVLKGFFGERGIEISFPATKAQQNKTNQNERWRVTLENVKKKYSSSPNLIKRNKVEISKKVKPKSPDKSISATYLRDLTKNFEARDKNSNLQSTPVLVTKTSPQPISKEEYCQTSIISHADQLIQCNFSTKSNSTSRSSFLYVTQENEGTENNSGQTNLSKESSSKKTFIDKKSKLHESVSKFIETKNEKHISMESREIDLGISLLCSLIESKNFNDRQKKKLAKKIVSRITQYSLKSENETDTGISKSSEISDLGSLSSTSSSSNKITSRRASNDVGIPSANEINIDRSEIRHGIKEIPIQTKSYDDVSKKEKTKANINTEKLFTDPKKTLVKNDKKTSSRLSDKENLYLFETMKEWLEPLTNSELAYDRKMNKESKENINSINMKISGKETTCNKKNSLDQAKDIQKREHLDWIENEIKRLENLKNLLITEKDSSTDKIFKKVPSQPNSQRVYDQVNVSTILNQKPTNNKQCNQKHIYDGTHSGTKRKDNKIDSNFLHHFSNSKSESQMTRLKLKTPTKDNFEHDSSDSIRTFVKNKKREFIENYKIAHSSRRSYDHPMISDHYSEPGYKNIPIVNKDFIFSSKYRTSVSTSNDFISSESISLPVNSGVTSTSTTHQYDATAINGIAVQTSDSVLETTPIFGISSEDKLNKADSNNIVRKTTRIYGPRGKNQQTQVKPQTISYTIKVDDRKHTEIKDNGNLSLQEHLQNRHPQFCLRSSKRQEILKEMQKLRKEREDQIRNIVENTSINSIYGKLKKIPPPPTKCLRIFSTKEMKAMTMKKQKCLSEVVDQVEKRKKEKQKKGTKILTEVFNKRLQKQVHKGKLSLEHSITVI